jgi:large subunit ribosomal protein L3
MNGILATKVGMTQIYNEDGLLIPVTVLAADEVTVVGVCTEEKNGYVAVQGASGEVNEKRLTAPVLGQYKKAGVAPQKNLKEYPVEGDIPEVGSTWNVSIFEGVDKVDVVGTSKGRGFAGTIKRHGFARGPMTHGSHNKRAPGSTGACSYPARVFPGKKLPGHYGDAQNTIRNLKMVKVDVEKNLIYVRGAVPGPKNGQVLVKKG